MSLSAKTRNVWDETPLETTVLVAVQTGPVVRSGPPTRLGSDPTHRRRGGRSQGECRRDE